ncbi:hypothetical protein LVB87_11950 [Lysobacter sp. KIS68-7]|uniref:cell envelope integrity protein TolA n=1 Tax=Lysobacter sp. KIS68-7 TaxID=2904252 RepID=UPI001E40F255|nr:cell envelope integrity protein TolA [Lysobacter sp. KIS68-7]UHQ18894.1 hypothetical protein LVB87_11950 [Lysobacter sp. KIS68-7]
MFSAADIIEALTQRRRLKSIRPETPGQLPPGWKSWLEGMSTSHHAVRGALPQEVIAELAQRELAHPPARSGSLNRWQAFATLWRQEWHGPIREERGIRLFAAAFSAVLHVFLGILLMWLAYVHVPPPAAEQGENVVQAEFIGVGTPEETGGGAPQGPKPEPQAAPAPAAAPQAAQQTPREAPAQPAPPQPAPQEPQPPQPPVEPPPVAAQPEPEPTPPAEVPPAPQPLQVTQVPQPDTTFVLPPPRPREANVPEREITVPEVRAPTERISRVQRPTQERIEVERITTQPTQVSTLRAEESARLSQAQAVQAVQTPSREINVPSVNAQLREIPMPSRGTTPNAQPGTSTAPGQATAPGTSTAPPSAVAGGPPAAAPGTGVTPGAQPGAGTTPNAPPGANPTLQRGDDWGVGTRNRPGGQPGAPGTAPGIFNNNGTPNIGEPPNPGQNAPGTVEAHIADLDRAGQWLKRPPYEYEPTTFDKYWRPRETLLQEWVRKGIKAIRIPIPGTSKSISCTISILQFGGACGLTDPNKSDQPASARPPPDIPFKPGLQEDNGSVRPPPPAPASTSAQPPGA